MMAYGLKYTSKASGFAVTSNEVNSMDAASSNLASEIP